VDTAEPVVALERVAAHQRSARTVPAGADTCEELVVEVGELPVPVGLDDAVERHEHPGDQLGRVLRVCGGHV
jgi:hypothetical protein